MQQHTERAAATNRYEMTCKNKFHRRNRRAGGEACAETTKEKLETSYDDDNHYF